MYIICYSTKIFRILRLAPISRLFLHNQPALTKFGRYKQYTIDLMIYLVGNEVDLWYIFYCLTIYQ